jgi:protein TonB
MRIGESRLQDARQRRWGRAYNALDPAVLQRDGEERTARRRRARLALGLALALHLALFAIVFPSLVEERILRAASAPRVYRLKQVQLAPPRRPPQERPAARPEARRIPVPDPSPQDPEPLILDETLLVAEPDAAEIGQALGVPDGPPGPSFGPLQISGDVVAPRRLYAPEPHYPEEARHARVQGVVILQTVIDTLGEVTNVRVLKGLPSGLTEAAVEAVSSWRFEPATLDGEPVAVYYIVTVSFSVQ